jgi:hypothetical protein
MGATVVTLLVTVQAVAGLVERSQRGAAIVGQVKAVACVPGFSLIMGQVRRGRSRSGESKQSAIRVPALASFCMHCPGGIEPRGLELLLDWVNWIATRMALHLALHLPISDCPNKSVFEGFGRHGRYSTIQLEPAQ